MRNFIASILLITSASAFAVETETKPPVVGPANGTLLVVGGGDKTSIWPTFVDLAGGKDAPIVVITTASPKSGTDNKDFLELQALGASNLTLLHTEERTEANSDSFVAPLRNAKAVWITGGRQWRLVDSYLNTKTEKEILNLLARGGLVGGSSAGASIQASYLLRGARSGNSILMAPGYEEGFGLLRNTAIDQHVNTRGRSEDMTKVLEAHPNLLGIGLDESTAIVVRKDILDALGLSVPTTPEELYDVLAAIKQAKPSAVLLGTAGAATTALVAGLRKQSTMLPIAGVSASLTQEGIRQLGGLVQGVGLTTVFPDPWQAKHKLVRDYQAAMTAMGARTFDSGSLEGYVNARIMVEALTRAGKGACLLYTSPSPRD